MQPLRRWPPPGMHLHWGSCGRLTGGAAALSVLEVVPKPPEAGGHPRSDCGRLRARGLFCGKVCCRNVRPGQRLCLHYLACLCNAASNRTGHEQLHDTLEEAMEKLTPQKGKVLRRIYYAGHTLQQIGTDEGLSYQRVQQIKNTAFRKLRNDPRLQRWRDEVISSHVWHGTGFGVWDAGGSVEERTVEYLEAYGAYCPSVVTQNPRRRPVGLPCGVLV